ncbi:MAG: succinate dehydrogenase cytochrome b subunit [Byssovorax sp.]
MSATAADAKPSRLTSFTATTIGQKATMAVTGIVLFGFVVVHMLGNLQVYLGPTKLNHYGELLQSSALVLWGARITLLLAVTSHAVLGMRLARMSRAARPTPYKMKTSVGSTTSSRTMVVSGLLIFFFVIYHLLHFTIGASGVHPSFIHGDVYHNVIEGFKVVPASIAYIIAMLGLGLHLNHGVWSLFQSLGVSHPRYSLILRRVASTAATLLVLGNVSIPLAVLTGVVH